MHLLPNGYAIGVVAIDAASFHHDRRVGTEQPAVDVSQAMGNVVPSLCSMRPFGHSQRITLGLSFQL